ncbi:MAG: NADH-quinone oxidoreductase subunit C [Phototrophicaceae bacterium]|jgi:NADH-quinone oxidoreductase subunit C
MSTLPPPQNPADAVKAKFGDALLHVKEFAGETTITVTAESLPNVMKFLKETPGLIYNFLSDISAVDYYTPDGGDYGDNYAGKDFRPERFGISYHVFSMLYGRRLRVKTYANEDAPEVPTLINLWVAADWLEREIMDMMGVTFVGHPDPRRLLMPEDWNGHPHRRDYPLGYETPMFSFNVEEIMKHKPSAKD